MTGGSGGDLNPSGDGSAVDRARVEARVSGRVQGVGFRYFVRQEAQTLGLDGWVANMPDGSVAFVADGPPTALERLLEIVSVGPPGAFVQDVDVRWGAADGSFSGFGVRSGWHSGD
jgi:acylphosphatase